MIQCVDFYKNFMSKVNHGPLDEMTEEVRLSIIDPVKVQMWHHSFDPHTLIPCVEQAQLKM